MCDRIKMPDGRLIKSISQNGEYLCANTQAEIRTWIIEHTRSLEIGERLMIEHTLFGWDVSIYSINRGTDARTPQH